MSSAIAPRGAQTTQFYGCPKQSRTAQIQRLLTKSMAIPTAVRLTVEMRFEKNLGNQSDFFACQPVGLLAIEEELTSLYQADVLADAPKVR